MQTEITQPAVLTADLALTRLLGAYGVAPDMVMGHSLGEYGALVAAGALTFDAALEAVSARGREMAESGAWTTTAPWRRSSPRSPRSSASSTAIDGYVVVANINSTSQAVIGGATDAVERAVEAFPAAGHQRHPDPGQPRVPHLDRGAGERTTAAGAAPARRARHRGCRSSSNVTGEFYPTTPTPRRCSTCSGRQVASPVQFINGLQTLYAAGARVFVEVGPKKALHGFVEDVLGSTTTSSRCSPTTRRSATSPRSTRRCAGCTRPGSELGRAGQPVAAAARPGRVTSGRRACAIDLDPSDGKHQ